MYLKDIRSLINDQCFIELEGWIPQTDITLKVEGFSATGSIKIKPALMMIEKLEREGILCAGKKIIESSSGNLGLALSMVCSIKGYHFTCVSDVNIAPLTEKTIKAYGTELIIVNNKDGNGGYLGSRLKLIKEILDSDKDVVWLNQYENLENINAHYEMTGSAILERVPNPDFVFIGAGTTGTLGGVSKIIRERSPNTHIVAVDTSGSVTFGTEPGKRKIPGLGTSTPPPIREYSSFDELIIIPEIETIAACRELASKGLLFGGSTGTVLRAIQKYSSEIKANSTVIAISPDLGEKYIDTIYDDIWVNKFF